MILKKKNQWTALSAVMSVLVKRKSPYVLHLKLYKRGNKSLLIKAGVALLVFPEPVVSDLLGTTLIAAGVVQQGIKRQSIYLDDLPKAFKSAMKDLKSARDLL